MRKFSLSLSLSLCVFLAACGTKDTVFTTQGLLRDPLLNEAWYSRVSKETTAENGASLVYNSNYEMGKGTLWYIEEQKSGANEIEAGLFMGSGELIVHGQKMFEWGFSKQAADGSFPKTGNAFHSTSFFVEAVARSLLLMKESGDPSLKAYVEQTIPKLEKSARWLLDSKVMEKGRQENAPFAHRNFIVAAALGETAALTENAVLKANLLETAEKFARDGIASQRWEGYVSEKGGPDSSYQAFSLEFSGIYYAVCTDPDLRGELRRMMKKGFDWELTRMNDDGSANLEGNTRVTNDPKKNEILHSGKPKTFFYDAALKAFVYGSRILEEPDYYAEAEKIAKFKKWIPAS